MTVCLWKKRIAAYFDGAVQDAEAARHAGECPACAEYLRELTALRAGIEGRTASPGISDSQFPAFMNGIREKLEASAPSRKGVWAFASLGLAAMIAAVATFGILSGGPQPVTAQSEVESCSTDLENGSVEYYRSEDGTVTMRVLHDGGDMW